LQAENDMAMAKYNATIENCRKAEEDGNFENGDQWESRDKSAREEDGRPCLVINKVAGMVKQVVGDARKQRPRIKARGVDDQSDPDTATLLTGLIRSIENQSDAEGVEDWGLECSLRTGYGFWRIGTDYVDDDVFEQDIVFERITDQFSVYLDPAHRKPTGEDARWIFEVENLTREDFEERYPGKEPVSWDISGNYTTNEEEENSIFLARYWYKKPVNKDIFQLPDGKVVEIQNPELSEAAAPDGSTVLVVESEEIGITAYVKHRRVDSHEVKWQLMSGAEILEKGDWAGKHIPIVRVIGEEVWIENKRQFRSVHTHARHAQQLYNWSRSNSAETLAMIPRQPYIGTPEMFEGHEEQWNQAHRKPMSRLLVNETALGLPQRQAPSLPDVGSYQEAQLSSDDIKSTTGYYDASLGARSNETSGIAIRERKVEGDNATFTFLDNLYKAVRYTGEILVDLIPKIYDTERVVRLLGKDDVESWVRINAFDPMTGQTLGDITVGRYDVVIDTGPNYQTQRIEAADGMLRFMQAFPAASGILAPRLAKVLDWPDAQEIAEELQQILQGAQQGQEDPNAQMEQEKARLDLEGKALVNQQRMINILQDLQQGQEQTYQIAQQAVADTLRQLFGERGVQ
jgi:hypothetical protein